MALGGAAGVLCGAGVMNAVTALAGAPNFRGTFGAAFGAVDVLVQALPLFVVNVLGSFLLGLLWAASRRRGPDWRPRLVAGLGTGFLGAFTTISSAVALVLWPVRLGAAASGAGGVLAAAVAVLLVLAAAFVPLIVVPDDRWGLPAAVAALRGLAPGPDGIAGLFRLGEGTLEPG